MSTREPLARIRTVIVDDEPLARSTICLMLRSHRQIEIVGECGSGPEALATIRRTHPDLMFLDVQMPECDGFDVVEQLGLRLRPVIVFVTAYDHYALRAFEAGALDYLLKPFDNARFERSLERALARIAASRNSTTNTDRLIIKSAGEISFLNISEIDWIEAADYYASLHLGAKTYLLRRSLKELDEELDGNAFLRIHRSYIVNQVRVQRLALNASGDYDVVLIDGTRLSLSRRYRTQVLDRLGVRTDKAP